MKIKKEWLKVQTTFEEIEQEFINLGVEYNLDTTNILKSFQSFKDYCVDGDEVWCFASPKLPLDYQEGYCIVRNGEIINFFRTWVS